MNWKKEAVNDLLSYRDRKKSLRSMREQIEALSLCDPPGCAAKEVSVKHSPPPHDERLLDRIVKRDRLALACKATEVLVDLTDRGMDALTERERLVLSKLYLQKEKGNTDDLIEELGYEKSQIYRIREDALRKFTVAMYGIEDY